MKPCHCCAARNSQNFEKSDMVVFDKILLKILESGEKMIVNVQNDYREAECSD